MAELAVVLTDDGVARRTRDAMRVGVHWDTETASTDARTARKKGRVAEERTRPHRVCQVFCSAVPVAYAQKETTVTHEEMEGISMLALEAAFEATLLAAALLSSARGYIAVYISVGEALYRALSLCRDSPLDVVMVHFGQLPEDNTPLEYLERLFGEEQAKHAA
ncbi:hypothetical protein T484DRAFT_1767696 [Baffinella frigidus]|nr:hypothetical protein T484DRAFT_1767696 [Cryptophyta sp. CCMP2293]